MTRRWLVIPTLALSLLTFLRPVVAEEMPAGAIDATAPILLASATNAVGEERPLEAESGAKKPVLVADLAPPRPAPPKKVKTAPAQAPSEAAQLVAKVQSFYESTADFSASFTQKYKYKAMARTQTSQGTVQVKKPGLMRWDYTKPHEKLFLLDGKSLWMWDPEDKSVMVNRAFSSDSLSAAVSFLWGRGRLEDEFTVTKVDMPKYGPTVLELVPKKPQSGFTKLFFAVDAATGAVNTSVVIDSQGNENRITFTDVKTNTGVKASRFTFEVPKGATVREL